ncbi:polymer-forming cytoskeletal protein [Ottowia sp.]|jgi:cytoskeletal protein CcmA (bactofilin family)|nr:polymer-forming cytoskeletal protein [Ottowia sp.]MBK6614549.1 polymer-forming cytoskeletal protein [Ottowia sp.]MBK6747254.1 polymer-forming cytoskeletal protein [Ottowia sp.]
MLGMKKQPPVRSAIGPGMRVTGDCTFQDGLQVDGTVLGDVIAAAGSPSALVVTGTGRVEGAISADHVVVGGTVVGPVLARELLELQSTARIQGDVRYKALEMQQGAVIAGQLQPQVTPPPAPVEPQAALAPAAEPAEPTLDPDRP